MKKLILSTTSSNENWNGDCDYAIVGINNDLIQIVKARKRLFDMVIAFDSKLYKMYFWDWSAVFFSPYLSKLDLEFTDKFEHCDFDDIWILPVDLEIPEAAFARVECTQMIVREEGIAWVTIPKHSSVYVITVKIPYNILKETI